MRSSSSGTSGSGPLSIADSSSRSRTACLPMAMSWAISRFSRRDSNSEYRREPMRSAIWPHEKRNTRAEPMTPPAIAISADPVKPIHFTLAGPTR
jgi:hypothetical protein